MHCMASPDLLLSKGGNFVEFAQLFAFGTPKTRHFHVDALLDESMAELPSMISSMRWYTDHFEQDAE